MPFSEKLLLYICDFDITCFGHSTVQTVLLAQSLKSVTKVTILMGGDLLFQSDALLMIMKDGWGGGALCDTDANKRGRDLHNIHHHTCHLNAHQYHNTNQLKEGLFNVYHLEFKFKTSMHWCVCVW